MSKAPKKPNWRSGEDRYLCGIYLDICQDPIVANNQKRDAFWQRIVAKYNDESRPSHIIERNFRSIQCRMSTILTECRKFDGCIKQVERLHPSGANQQIILQNANEFFVQDKGSAFKFDHVFEMVKDILQLETTRSVSSLPQENPDSVNHSLSSFEINLSSDENFSTGGSSSQRPEGVKKSKAKRKQSEDVSILAKSFNESTEKLRETLSFSQAQRELALQLEKEKQQLEKEKQQLERERLEVMKKGQEMKQLKREDKILAMDTDAISDPERRNYFRNLQQQILRKRTEEEQSTSTTFNVFGMNFDNLGGSGGGLSGY